jgi:octaprenyl-diphosphate synthase
MFAADSKASSSQIVYQPNTESVDSWRQIIDPVDPFLTAVSQGLAKQVDVFDPSIGPYAEYALNGDGKHLRPALVALTANALGRLSESHVTAGVIIEMVHLATLVHDDIIDEAEIRRGRLTLAANWGNEIAVLFGDCLFAQALTLAAGFPTTEVCRSVATATKTVCSGEILQTQHRRDFQFSGERYFKVLEMKTAELFALSCELSAFLSGASLDQRAALRQFGLAFGTAYQIYDDCVDLFGSETVAGKSLGTDLAKGKLTLPVLLLWDRANPANRLRLEELVANWQPESLTTMLELLHSYETLNASREVVNRYLARASELLMCLPVSQGRKGLLGLTQYLKRQTSVLGGGA